jgi:hypothetical protein
MPEALLIPAPVSATQGRRDPRIAIKESTDSLMKRIRQCWNADSHET